MDTIKVYPTWWTAFNIKGHEILGLGQYQSVKSYSPLLWGITGDEIHEIWEDFKNSEFKLHPEL